MSKKRPPKMPRVIITPRGRYVAQVFLINTKEKGVPRLCTMIPDDHEINLAGGEEFLIAYVPEHMTKPDRK